MNDKKDLILWPVMTVIMSSLDEVNRVRSNGIQVELNKLSNVNYSEQFYLFFNF